MVLVFVPLAILLIAAVGRGLFQVGKDWFGLSEVGGEMFGRKVSDRGRVMIFGTLAILVILAVVFGLLWAGVHWFGLPKQGGGGGP